MGRVIVYGTGHNIGDTIMISGATFTYKSADQGVLTAGSMPHYQHTLRVSKRLLK